MARPFYNGFTAAEVDTLLSEAKTALTAVLLGKSYTLSSGNFQRNVTRADEQWLVDLIAKLGDAKDYLARGSKNITHTLAKIV